MYLLKYKLSSEVVVWTFALDADGPIQLMDQDLANIIKRHLKKINIIKRLNVSIKKFNLLFSYFSPPLNSVKLKSMKRDETKFSEFKLCETTPTPTILYLNSNDETKKIKQKKLANNTQQNKHEHQLRHLTAETLKPRPNSSRTLKPHFQLTPLA